MKPILLVALLLIPALACAQGALTPAAGPGPTMKTLAQIEPRVPVEAGSPGIETNSDACFTIAAPGSYYLTRDIAVTSGHAVVIDANNVTLDLNGFTLSSSNPERRSAAIYVPVAHDNLTIRNGHIVGDVTVDTSGAVSGAGFEHGIYCPSTLSTAIISDVTVQGVGGNGISTYQRGIVTRCAVGRCGGTGIQAFIVSDCVVTQCGEYGIRAVTVSNSMGTGYTNTGIAANLVTNSYGYSDTGAGIYASGTVSFSQGDTGSRTGTAIFTRIAVACTSSLGVITTQMGGKQLGTE